MSGKFLYASAESELTKSAIKGKLISCKGLKNVDLFGTSDPFVMMRLIDSGGNIHGEAKSSTKTDDLNPTWDNEFFDFCAASADIMNMSVLFKIMDSGLAPDEDLGEACVPVSLIPMMSEESEEQAIFDFSLGFVNKGMSGGSITVALGFVPKPGITGRTETSMSGKFFNASAEWELTKMEIKGKLISCKGLKNVDLFGKADPFVMMQLIDSGGNIHGETKSSSQIDDLDPVWEDETFNFCPGSADIMNMSVLFKVMDIGLGPDEEVGEACVPVSLVPMMSEGEEQIIFNFSLGVVNKGKTPAGLITVALGLISNHFD